MQMKKGTVLLLVLALVIALAAACTNGGSSSNDSGSSSGNTESSGSTGGSGGTANTDQPSAPSEADAKAAELQKLLDTPTEIRIFTGDGEGDFADPAGRYGGTLLREKFPNWTFTNIDSPPDSNFRGYMATNPPPFDILVAGAIGRFLTPYGLESDMSDLIEKYDFDLSVIQPGAIKKMQDLGGIYGIPYYGVPFVFVYNKDLFDKFGVPYPTDGMTWDEIFELAKQLTRTEAGVNYYGFGANFFYYMLQNQYGAQTVDPDTKKALYLEPNFVKVFENIGRFYKTPGMERKPFASGEEYDDEEAFFQEGVLAMFMDTSGVLNGAASAGMNFDVLQAPSFPDIPGVGFDSMYESWFLTSVSENREAAFQVLTFIASEEYQIRAASYRAIPSTLAEPSRVMAEFGKNFPGLENTSINVDAIIPAKSPNPPRIEHPWEGIVEDELWTAFEEYLAGADVNTVLRAAAERTDQRIASE